MTASNMGNAPERNSNAKEERKLRKPLIEKRRRERINCSLEQLKGIMVDAYNLDQSKLEKADVLEVTVQHMEGLQKGHGTGSPGPSAGFESRQRYSSGYIQCMHEVHNLLLSCPGMDKPLGARLLNHLLKSLPHLSSETGSTGNTGSPNGAVTTGGSGGSCNSSPLPGSGPASPPQSPLSLPSGAPFRPRRLQLHAPASPSPPAHPQPPSPSHRAPLVQLLREGRGIEGWVREQPASPTSSPPFSPNLQPGVLHPALPPFFPGGDPSMWRPW